MLPDRSGRLLDRLLDRDWRRPGPTPRQQRHDLLVGVGTAAACVASVELWRSMYATPLGAWGVEAYLLFAVAGLALAARRRLPLTVLLVESVLFIVIGERLGQLGATFTIQMVMFASVYAAWAWSTRTRLLLLTTAAVLAAMFGWLVWALLERDALPPGSYGLLDADVATFAYSIIVNVVYFGGAIAWGHAAWGSARRRALIEAQQEAERRQRRRDQERAVQDERVRIARDLHDVVAHHVSSIGVQAAGAARVFDRDPATAREALDTIEASSRQAVDQMRRLVGLLRDDEQPETPSEVRAPQPGLRDLPALAADGPPTVTHRVVGEPFPVPDTVGLSLFRVAQEAVTNVRRHAHARNATVVLRYLDDPGRRAVEVEVLDDGRGPAGPSDGYGLRGVVERAALHGGTAEVGPRPERGLRVRVRVPVPGDAA